MMTTDPQTPPRPLRTRVWRFLRWPLALLLLCAATLIGINVVDEDLSADARAMLEPPANQLRDSDNLFVLLAGLDAPAGEDMQQRGLQNIREFQAVLAARRPGEAYHDSRAGRTPDAIRQRVQFSGEQWRPFEASIWDSTRRFGGEVEALAQQHGELLQRYAALQASRGYHDILPPDATAPPYAPESGLRSLYLADVARRIQAGSVGERQAALQSLAADIALWRRMLQGEGLLLSKMLPIAYLHADYLLLSDMAADPGIPVSLLREHASLFEPAPLEAWRIGKVFLAEFRFVAEAMRPLQQSAGVGSWFYLRNASLNQQASVMRRLQQLADGDPAEFAAFTAADAQQPLEFPSALRNPTGRILVRIAVPAYQNYIERVFDTVALERASALAWRLRVEAIPEDSVASYLAEHPELSTHPAGGGEFQWNADAGEIRVPLLAHQSGRRRNAVRALPRL